MHYYEGLNWGIRPYCMCHCLYCKMSMMNQPMSNNFEGEIPEIDDYSMRELTPAQCSGFLYKVQRGDTLFSIAQHYKISFNALINANPQITNPDAITIGQTICVPGVMPLPTPIECTGQTYNVRSGDTLTSIARKFNVTVSALLAANPIISDPNYLVVGLILCIPQAQPAPTPTPCDGQTYIVRSGDTLTSIARRFNVTVTALLAANPIISDPNYLVVGLILCIPKA